MSMSSAVSAVALCAIAAGGCAQHRVATSFAELERHVKPGRTVYLTSTNGEVRKGTLERFTGESADLNVSGATVHVLERDTVQMAVPESLWQGALIGAAAGAFLGAGAQQNAQFLDCAFGPPRDTDSDCESGTPVVGMLAGAGLGAAIGAGLDALVWKRTRIFAAPEKGGSVVLLPIAGPRGVGLRVTARF